MNRILLVLLAIVSVAHAQTLVTLEGVQYPAGRLEFSVDSSATAELVFGGLGDVRSAAWAGKVVLVDRGTIPFVDKARNAELEKAVAVIVANNVEATMNPTLGEGHGIKIPVVFVSRATGDTLKTKVGKVARVGSPAPPLVLPDAVANKGKFLKSDGEKWVGTELPEPGPGLTSYSEVEIGKRLAFSVSASGTPPFTFQWMKNGANIPGATTASLEIPAATAADAGRYSCQVSNPFGTAPSDDHIVTVK